MPSKEVDTAALFICGPVIDSATNLWKTGLAHNAAGVNFSFHEETQAGATFTAITPTTGSTQDWVELGDGYYSIEITAAQLNTAGQAWVAGFFTGVYPFESVHYDIIDPTNATNLVALIAAWADGGRLDLILDIIAADTTTDIPALIATAQADLDIITGATGVNLLAATQTSIDAIETDSNALNDTKIPDTISLAAIADALWNEVLSGHLTAGFAGRALSDAFTAASNLNDTSVPAIKVITDALGATAAAQLNLSANQIITFTVDTVTNTHTPTTTEFQADDITEATANHYNGRIVIFTSGALAGQVSDITSYEAVGGIGQFTVSALTEAPANDDTGIIL